MQLTRAVQADYEAVCTLYQAVIAAMEASGLDQWQWGVYPSAEIVADDINQGEMYVLREEGEIIAAVCVNQVQDEEYAQLDWHFGVNPGLFHRLAIAPDCQGRGLGRVVLDGVCDILRDMGCDCLRCDTYSRNAAALRLYDRFGMRRARQFHFPWKEAPFVPFEKPLTDRCVMLPIRMTPAFRAGELTPWGGEQLRSLYGKEIPCVPAGESMECSCIPGLESRDETGTPLPALIDKYGWRLVGRYADKPFPLLLKLLDAKDTLSVQVHPDDAYAAANEGKLGKTEAWLILHAEEGSELVYGVNPGVTMDQLRQACETGSAVAPLLRRVQVKPGDVCYIPAGCVHAICGGIVLYEIQQSSDVTYRFYDWDRTDSQGRKRPLHIEQALAVTDINCRPEPIAAGHAPVARVLDTPYFTLDMLNVRSTVTLPADRDVRILTGISGTLRLCMPGKEMTVNPGDTLLLPVHSPEMTLAGEGCAALSGA